MGILAGDIKLVESHVMDDVPEGGGAPTGTIINDGTSNGIFNDISELDRAGGRVNLRKVFATVRTPDTEGFFGVNVIVADPYDDPLVSTTLFTTEDAFDTRDNAADRMESYLARGPSYSGYLFGDHIAGQMSVTLLQRIETTLPFVGQTLVLVKNLALGNEFGQFVRITDIEATQRTFTDASGDFTRMEVVLGISDVLEADFPGFDALRADSSINYTGKTKTFDTIVADAARYYGVVKLEDDADIGDYVVKTEGIYTQLVPSTRVEVPIADSRLNQQSAALVKAGDAYNRTITSIFTTAQGMFIGGSILPGSLSVARGGITITDKGGVLVDASNASIGTVDYANGHLTLNTNVFGTSSGAHTVIYTPATRPTIVTDSVALPVTAESQRLSWTLTLDPPPARNTLQVSFRAIGRWYVLTEDGSGAIRGADSSFGAGTINFSTGTITLTLGAMPDVDSAIVYTYSASILSRPLTSLTAVGPSLARALGKPLSLGQAVKPGTISITWNDGSARTSTDSGGVLTGDATGAINYAEGIIDFRPNLLPAKNTSISISITEATQQEQTIGSLTDGGSAWTCTLTAPLKARSVELAIIGSYQPLEYPDAAKVKNISVRLFDDGSGNLLMANVDSNVIVGTVNYSTGDISIPKTYATFKYEKKQYGYKATPDGIGFLNYGLQLESYATSTVAINFLNGPGVNTPEAPIWGWWGGSQADGLEARFAGSDGSADSQSISFDSIFLPANPNGYASPSGYAERLTSFFIGSSLYVHRDTDNTWQKDPSPTTGNGTEAGADAIIGGVKGALITEWTTGASSTPTGVVGASIPSASGTTTLMVVDGVCFRTAVSPLVNSGFQVAGNWAQTGAGFTATANSSGVLSSGSAPVGETPGSYGVFGVVDYEMGLANIRFGRRVPESMAGGDFVIDLSDLGIPGVEYIESYPAQADTLRYNAVGYSYLPLDPDILGLNPVRLPADGRVPIFRPGSFAVIGNTDTVAPATYSNGNTVDCGRERLSRVRLIGNDGLIISTGYTADLDTGIVTITNVSGWSQPVTVEHRVEDMMLVSDAQINGQLSFTRPVTHDYEGGESYVSSALVAGDVRARTSLVFDQVTWTNVWSDSPIGSSATGTYNDVQHPIEVTNLGALTERWAAVFTSSTAFNVIGEHVGVIASGNTGSDCAPNNPATGEPYFTLQSEGWGLGWSTGNVLRFNTVGAMVPVWVARTILQGPATVEDDSFTLLVRGDVDHP